MARINIKTTLKNKEDFSSIKKSLKGILRENEICYQEEDTMVSLIILENSILLKRKDKEKCLEFVFEKENSNLKITFINENKELIIPINLLCLNIEKEKIYVAYEIDTVKEFTIEYEVLSWITKKY